MLLRISELTVDAPFELLEDAQNHYEAYALDETLRHDNADIVVHEDICELGEQLPLFDRMIVHGVAVQVTDRRRCNDDSLNCDDKGQGFIFSAPSGVGKSTHARLWQRLLGEDRVTIINGDKPIVRQRGDGGAFEVYGTPWCGKEGLHQNVSAPLRGIALLHRGTPSALRATKEEFFDFMTSQTFLPQDPTALKRTFDMLEHIYNNVPVYHIYADLSRQCIELSVKTLYENYQRI